MPYSKKCRIRESVASTSMSRVPMILLLVGALFLFWTPQLVAQSDQEARMVLKPQAPAQGSVESASWMVNVDASLLENNPSRLRLQFPDGTWETVERTSWDRQGGVLGWDGRVVGARREFSTVTLAVMDGVIAGVVDTEEARYRFAPRAEGQMLLRTTRSEGECSGAVVPPRDLIGAIPAQVDGLVEVTEEAGRPVVSVLLLFTPQAASAIGGAIQQQATASVRYLNRVLDNSGARGSARLAAAEIIDTLDGENGLDNYLSRLRRDPEAARLRALHRADVVQLYAGFSEAGGDCGIAYLLQRFDSSRSMAPFAFGTNSIRCAPEATFAHEFGHNVGLNHNPEDAGSPFPFKAYAYAHRNGSVKTTMSYGSQREIAYYSTPLLNVNGFVPGVADTRDNVRTLYDSMVVASGYVGQQDTVGVEAPSGLEGELVGADSAVLQWQDNSGDETGFRVESRPAGAGWSTVANAAANATQATVTGLPGGTSILFRVRAVRSGQRSSPSNVISLETSAVTAPPTTLTAMPISSTQIELSWEAAETTSLEPVRLTFASRSPVAGETVAGVVDGYTGDAGSLLIEGLAAETPYSFTGYVDTSTEESPVAAEPGADVVYGNTTSATTMGPGGACDPNDEATLCLQNGRFEVRSAWRTEQGTSTDSGPGTGLPITGSEESGRFWFFEDSNVELLVKVLDARVINGSYWHFYGALSDVEYWITVRDTETGDTRTYYNPRGEQCGFGDIAAFPELPLPGAAAATLGAAGPVPSTRSSGPASPGLLEASAPFEGPSCTADGQTVCLGDGRFSVRVDWQVGGANPENGVGVPLPELATDDTEFFWFFDESNVELAVKVLDARVINNRYWFYWGALSDVAYQIRIYDHETAQEMVVENTQGNLCGGSDIETLGAAGG